MTGKYLLEGLGAVSFWLFSHLASHNTYFVLHVKQEVFRIE